MFRDIVKDRNVYLTALTDLLDLPWCLDELPVKHRHSFSAISFKLCVKCLVAFFVLQSAPAPAGIVSPDLDRHLIPSFVIFIRGVHSVDIISLSSLIISSSLSLNLTSTRLEASLSIFPFASRIGLDIEWPFTVR